jgi:hypothetical protein
LRLEGSGLFLALFSSFILSEVPDHDCAIGP